MAMGLIETVRVRRGEAPLWSLHLRRLRASCLALGVPFPEGLTPPAGGEDRVVRFQVDPSGVAVTERAPGPTSPVRLVTSPVVYHPYPHKTTDRDQFDRTRAAALEQGADDGVLLTPERYVAESAIWAVLWWENGRLCGPPLELGILPSVGRARVDELVGGIMERRARVADLTGCSVLLVNAARGVVEVASWDRKPVPPRPETAALAARFWP
jgi:branched-subunit amino acid aminotransferase/4-amino-4-deoxychorismate lyase